MKRLIVFAVVLALAGCQSSEEVKNAFAKAAPAPESVKAQIVHDARDFLADPYSIRDAEISYMQLNVRSGIYWLCAKANAKNLMGGYSGRQAIEIWVRNGRLVGNVPNSAACNHPSLQWQPFPELEALKNI